MSNSLHVEIARRGATEWNKWREANRDLPNLSEADLSGVDLAGADLHYAQLNSANLTAAILVGSNLHATNLEGARLNAATMDDADLTEANLEGAHLDRASLRSANLRASHLRGASLVEAILQRTLLDMADLREANFEGADARGASACAAGFMGARLNRAIFRWADLREAKMIGAQLAGADFQGANLTDAWLSGSGMYGLGEPERSTNLSHTRLIRAKLNGIEAFGVNLSKADLSGAHLYEARLSDSDLHDANLTEANLGLAWLHRANLRNANLTRAHLHSADLAHADLTGASLVGTDLSHTSLVGARLCGCDLMEARVYGTSVWDVETDNETRQTRLNIARPEDPTVLVDNLELAQLIYLLLNRQRFKDLINAVTKRGVLILGRFGGGGIEVLQEIAEWLRSDGYLPMLFDFERPRNQSYSETVKTLAGMARFVIVDLSGPSVPQELTLTVPYHKIPFIPILEEGRMDWSMLPDILEYSWVLRPAVRFSSADDLKRRLVEKVYEAEARIERRETALRDAYSEEPPQEASTV